MWLGGWRPSTTIVLVYSLMGVQLQDEIRNFGYGIRHTTNSTSVLSQRQITNLSNVQKTTRDVEQKLTKKLAEIQVKRTSKNLKPRSQIGLACVVTYGVAKEKCC